MNSCAQEELEDKALMALSEVATQERHMARFKRLCLQTRPQRLAERPPCAEDQGKMACIVHRPGGTQKTTHLSHFVKIDNG